MLMTFYATIKTFQVSLKSNKEIHKPQARNTTHNHYTQLTTPGCQQTGSFPQTPNKNTITPLKSKMVLFLSHMSAHSPEMKKFLEAQANENPRLRRLRKKNEDVKVSISGDVEAFAKRVENMEEMRMCVSRPQAVQGSQMQGIPRLLLWGLFILFQQMWETWEISRMFLSYSSNNNSSRLSSPKCTFVLFPFNLTVRQPNQVMQPNQMMMPNYMPSFSMQQPFGMMNYPMLPSIQPMSYQPIAPAYPTTSQSLETYAHQLREFFQIERVLTCRSSIR